MFFKSMAKLEALANTALNQLYFYYRRPPNEILKNVKLVAHRGVHENYLALENTLESFDLCLKHNIWGVEFDIRWTKDNVPVVHHDVDLLRVFGHQDVIISQLTYPELNKIEPRIPTLKEVIFKYGKKLHLMIELKDIITSSQSLIFSELLKTLRPGEDFHVLSLKPENFNQLTKHLDKKSFMLVGKFNEREMTTLTIENGYGAFSAHFFNLNAEFLNQLKSAGVKIGTGFPETSGCLYREITRGVEWIFTNHPIKLMNFLQ
jgi:glycerophosphoryl diester phosphodiesterase